MQPAQTLSRPVVASQASLSERMAFLKRIYGLLSISVFMAAAGAWVTLNNQDFLMTVAQNMMIFFIIEIAAIFFVFWARKRETIGLVALYGFTFLTGVTTAPVLLIYTGASIVNAAILTGLAFVGLSVYAITSKKDFSFMGGFLTTGLIVLIVGGLLNTFVFHSSLGASLYSIGGALLFCGFIVYDTFNILNRYPTDEHISATLSLYLDILNLFLLLLHLLGGSRD